MALLHWPGFESGGTAWFPDLTASALSLHPLAAPLGAMGIVLPAAIATAYVANIDLSFARLPVGKA